MDEIVVPNKEFPEFPLPMQGESEPAIPRKQLLFTGEWDPSEDPLKLGEQNYAVLENLRYRDVGLEGVSGYTKINTTALATYLKGRSGIQLQSPYANKSHVLIQAENAGETASQVLENRTAVPDQGDFESAPLHTDASGAGQGRFAAWPEGHVAYCNGKESCIYAGDEIRCAGFFSIYTPKIVRTDISFHDNGGSADTVVTESSNFNSAGFKVGHVVTITGSTSNNVSARITAVSTDGKTITFEPGVLTDEAAGDTVSITVNFAQYHTETTDYTQRVTDAANAIASCAAVSGTTGYLWVMLSPRPLSAVRYKIRTANTETSETTCRVWDGEKLAAVINPSDGTVSAGKSMAQDGSFSFHSTVGSAQPLHFEGLYLYAYIFELSAGAAEIHHVTLTAPYQEIIDIWDGIKRHPVMMQVSRGLTAETTGTSSNGTITTVYPTGYDHNTIAEISDADDYEALHAGTEITANSVSRTVTQKIFTRAISVTPYEVYFREPFGWEHPTDEIYSFGLRQSGFQVGDMVTVNNSDYNDGTYEIIGITGGGTTLQVSGALTNEYKEIGVGLSRPATRYVELDQSVDWYNGGSGYAFTYKNPVDETGTADYKDFTLEVNEPSYADFPIGALIDGLDSANHILLAFEERVSALQINMIADKVNINPANIRVGYYNGSQYVSQKIIFDSSQGKPGSSGAGKSLNRSGMIAMVPLHEKDEFKQTVFGVNAYFYQITFTATLSGTEGGDAEVIIDTIYGIPAQKSVKGYKFPALFGDVPLLCGRLGGKEGNRVDYGASGTTCVFNGDDSSNGTRGPLYIGDSEELTAFCEVYSRYGLQMTNIGIFTKNRQVHLLVGNTTDEWQVHSLSGTVGCPAPLTMDSFDVGRTLAGDPQRQVAMWLSYNGPVLFENGVLDTRVGYKIRCYFDKDDPRCINYAAIDKSQGRFDPDTGTYHLLIPSGTGQTTLNVWLAYDLVRNRWYRLVPAGTDPYPQALIRVVDANGAQYLYGCRDNGHMMRLENGTTWDGEGIAQKVVFADQVPTGDVFDITLLRKLKLFAVAVSEDVSVVIKHYKNGSSSGTSLVGVPLKGSTRFIKHTQSINLEGWSHQLEFSVTTVNTEKGFQPLGLSYQYEVIRADE